MLFVQTVSLAVLLLVYFVCDLLWIKFLLLPKALGSLTINIFQVLYNIGQYRRSYTRTELQNRDEARGFIVGGLLGLG